MKLRRGRALALALAFPFAVSCGDSHGPGATQQAEQAALGGEVAARVGGAGGGGEVIPLSLVQRVAIDQRVTPQEALRRLVDDAIAANAARERGLDRATPTSWLLAAARARVTVEKHTADSRAAGPPTDDEIRTLSEKHWREVDRPPAVRVVHAVAQASGDASTRARAVAEDILEAVRSARDEAEFQAKAKAVPHPADINVVVQPLPAIIEDGRSIEASDVFDATFAKAAFSLSSPGETRVIETKFGWHVMRLVERIPEQRMDHDARRIAFGDAAYAERARATTDARLAALRAAHPIVISPSAEQLMRTLHVARGPAQ
jgi:peptidyl-prolyl cis-trans isomerase C